MFEDRIAVAFVQLRDEHHFEVLEDLPHCHDCGLRVLRDLGVDDRDAYVFYHQQDVVSMNAGNGCHISWGSDGQDAELVLAALAEAGLEASWDKNTEHRIFVKGVKE